MKPYILWVFSAISTSWYNCWQVGHVIEYGGQLTINFVGNRLNLGL